MEMIAVLRFRPGLIVASTGVMSALSPEEAMSCLVRHLSGDWGDVDEGDWKQNDAALEQGLCLLSRYCSKDGTKFWIVTEADRSRTTILLPSESILQPSVH